ncbi:MAG: cytochrome c1 [Rickettsiales bacterium]|nr:cytochrome c1 [Rickettsiales bacterium]
MAKKQQDLNGKLQGVAMLIGLVIVASLAYAVFSGGHGDGEELPATKTARHAKQSHWAFDGHFGTFDRAAIQRGFQVYREVCSACHGMSRIAFRNLQEVGFSEAEVKSLAAEYSYAALDGEGEEIERPGKPSDRIPSPFANADAARAANNGAFPPDLSLMAKARPDGANYMHSLLTGYEDAPEGFALGEGQSYNPYFEGRQIAMAAPLVMDGQVSYEDETDASMDQMAKDVVTFLQWAAEPEMEARKRMGLKVLLFLLVFSGFFYVAKKRVWKDVQ